MNSSPATFSQFIKTKAAELGFDACGISRAKPLEEDRERLLGWLGSGYHGTMDYMSNYLEKRVNPIVLVESSKSVVSVLLNYYTDQKQEDPSAPKISKYALGKDYHDVLKARLFALLDYIRTELAPCEGRAFVDSAPLLEKALAKEAGLGWIGKNSLLIHPRMGSFVFIGELVLDLELEYDEPFGNSLCGSCTRCMDSCPTGAIISPFVLDARKCISYLTIETKENISESLARNLSNYLVGCDICQQVCPWNSKAKQHNVDAFRPKPELLKMNASEWQSLEKPQYNRLFKDSAVERAGFTRMKRTLVHLFGQTWIAFDGLNLYATLWKPDVSPKAVIAFVHGHGTHSRRYEEWYNAYLKRGFAVITFDLRGHGRSGGKQGTIHQFNEYLEDVDLLMRKARENFPHLPIVLYGHSMGATIVLSFLQMATNLPEMAVLASAWLELVQPPGKFKSLAIWLADSLLPQMTIKTGLKSKDFAPPVPNEILKERDPLMHKKISARCFREVERATKKINAETLPTTVPMLFMHGTNDRVSASAASEKLALGLPGKATYRDWEDGPHQLLTWEQAEKVTDFTIDWINKQL